MKIMECSHLPAAYHTQSAAYVRFLHASPGTQPVDVYANGELVASDLRYKQTAGYYVVAPGQYCIQILPSGLMNKSGKGECCLTEALINICPNSSLTIAIICAAPELGLLGVSEIISTGRLMKNPCRTYIRFVNLSPNAPPLDLTWFDGTRLFQAVPFRAHTRYKPIDVGTYKFKLKPTGSTQPGIVTQEYTFEKGTAYTLYATGLIGGAPPLETVLTVDGNY